MAHKTKVWEKQEKRDERRAGQFRERIKGLETDLFCLREYICSEGLMDEAREYLMENAGKGIPFDFE